MKPIRIKIRSTWQGQVGIRDKYVKEAKRMGRDLLLVVGNEAMTVAAGEIEASIVATSEHPVKDYFSEDVHYLIYFRWKPDKDNQMKMF